MRLIDAVTLKAEFTGNFQDSYPKPEIHALIDLAPTIGGWISVKDRLPDAAGCMVLVLAHNDHLGVDSVFTAFLGYGEMKWYTYDTTKMSLSLSRPSDNAVIKAYTITHWMPLPEPLNEDIEE